MQSNHRKFGLKYGIIGGIALIIFSGILYKAGVKYYLGEVAYLGYAITIGLAATAALSERQAGGGYLDFRQALRTAFTVFVIALAAQTLFTWWLMDVFDTHFKGDVSDAILQRTETFLRGAGLTDDKLDQAMSVERSKDQYAPKYMIMGLAISYIAHFLIALLIAAIVKKKKPVFSESGI